MSEAGEVRSEGFSERNGVLVRVDHDICVGFSDCVVSAPEVFFLNDDNLAVVVEPDAVDLDTLKQAAGVCPVSAILLFGEDGTPLALDA